MSKNNIEGQFDFSNLDQLCCVCVLLAAKLEQPKKPDFLSMTNALYKINEVSITVESLVELELQVLAQLGFDFNFLIEPLDFLRRYLNLLGYGEDEEVRDTAIHLLLLQIYDCSMLEFSTSIICAAISIIVVNLIEIHKLTDGLSYHELKFRDNYFFKKATPSE